MRAVVQRVSRATVRVDAREVASIGHGLVVLVGVADGDTSDDARALASKLVGLRVFRDDDGRMNRSVGDAGGAVLVVSQFTLIADVRRGRRPSFVDAAPPDTADGLVDEIVETIAQEGIPVEAGVFGASMEVDLVNDGPVTIVLDVDGGKVV